MTFRKLHIGDQEWQYFVGKKNVVIKYPGENRKITASIGTITGHVDSMHLDVPVNPSDVKEFIEKTLL